MKKAKAKNKKNKKKVVVKMTKIFKLKRNMPKNILEISEVKY